ncbi:VOC family protein [Emcibacter nanhaiensis]|uniref:Glyoxalase n=1 Tax=Emcibacter nanhaiensis TaxID=1505037 RepID=A0A501PAH4_9PROT|nr:VOC family protein [Emcibacter nanhaiensis]TPD57379.1 glyoxalase [Emcibacter nanhaiensis]
MPLKKLHHYNIWTADLQGTLEFYSRVLGLEEGPRPEIPTPGAWMYDPSGEPVLHIYDGGAIGRDVPHGGGALDHVAFEAEDFEAMVAHMEATGTAYTTNLVEGIGLSQIFVDDPNGITIELNFMD